MTHTDRRTARDRVRLVTAGLAVGGALGVAGVAGGMALQSDQAAAGTGTPQTSSSTSDSNSTQSSTSDGVSSSSSQSNAQSSGS
jgi:hypothetical protein